jgi:hypothetical protein
LQADFERLCYAGHVCRGCHAKTNCGLYT